MATETEGCFTHSAFAYLSNNLVARMIPNSMVCTTPSEVVVQTRWVVSKMDMVNVNILLPHASVAGNPAMAKSL